jgi:hypothetical protein
MNIYLLGDAFLFQYRADDAPHNHDGGKIRHDEAGALARLALSAAVLTHPMLLCCDPVGVFFFYRWGWNPAGKGRRS